MPRPNEDLRFNSKPKSVTLPEPSKGKVQKLIHQLLAARIEVRGKTPREVVLPPAGG